MIAGTWETTETRNVYRIGSDCNNELKIFNNENVNLKISVCIVDEENNKLTNNYIPLSIKDDVTKKEIMSGKLIKNGTEIVWTHKNKKNTIWEKLT